MPTATMPEAEAKPTTQDVKSRPLGDRVLVKPHEEQGEIKRNGIIIPENAKEKPQKGTIIAVGKGRRTEDGRVLPMDVSVGDVVWYGKYCGSEVKIAEQTYLLMNQDDLMMLD